MHRNGSLCPFTSWIEFLGRLAAFLINTIIMSPALAESAYRDYFWYHLSSCVVPCPAPSLSQTFVTLFSRTTHHSHSIFGMQPQLSVPYRAMRFQTSATPTSCLPTYSVFEHLYGLKWKFSSHFSQELLIIATGYLVCSLSYCFHTALYDFIPLQPLLSVYHLSLFFSN